MNEDSSDGKESQTGNLSIDESTQIPPTITFSDNSDKDIGVLYMDLGGKLKFDGDMEKSAKIFFEGYLKPMFDGYVAEKLKRLEKAKELCRKYTKATEFWDEFIQHDFVEMPLTCKHFVNHIGQEILDVLENGSEQASANSPVPLDGG